MKTSLLIMGLLMGMQLSATTVRFETTAGDFDVELYEDEAPVTVQNFLNYVNRGDYDDTVIHRSVPGFVLQGGGYRYLGSNTFEAIPTDGTIINESQVSNTEGTISMARLADPNSARSQWFFNLVDNTGLDGSDSQAGFAVFGKVTRGLEVLKLIESFLRINFSSSNVGDVTAEFPIYGFFSGTAVTIDNAVKINRVFVLSEDVQINPGLSGAWFNPATDGQGIYLEVLPAAGIVIVAWFTFDTAAPDDMVMNQVGYAGSRWLTAVGGFSGNQVNGSLYKTTGGIFDDPAAVDVIEVGTFSIEFSSCGQATMTHNIIESGLSNTTNLQRISGDNIALCETLSSAANTGVATN